MFERFTDEARRAVVLAQEEARLQNHGYIGSEHILLGVLQQHEIAVVRALADLGLTLRAARDRIVELVGRGAREPSGHIPFTPGAKAALEHSLRHAQQLRDSHIRPEHILLGVFDETTDTAARIVLAIAGDLETPRARVRDVLTGSAPD